MDTHIHTVTLGLKGAKKALKTTNLSCAQPLQEQQDIHTQNQQHEHAGGTPKEHLITETEDPYAGMTAQERRVAKIKRERALAAEKRNVLLQVAWSFMLLCKSASMTVDAADTSSCLL
jgi:hypothetical protein